MRCARALIGDLIVASIYFVELDRLDHFCTSHEHRTCAGKEQKFSAKTGILHKIGLSACYRTGSKSIGYEKSLKFGLDDEQPFEFFPHNRCVARAVPVLEFRDISPANMVNCNLTRQSRLGSAIQFCKPASFEQFVSRNPDVAV